MSSKKDNLNLFFGRNSRCFEMGLGLLERSDPIVSCFHQASTSFRELLAPNKDLYKQKEGGSETTFYDFIRAALLLQHAPSHMDIDIGKCLTAVVTVVLPRENESFHFTGRSFLSLANYD